MCDVGVSVGDAGDDGAGVGACESWLLPLLGVRVGVGDGGGSGAGAGVPGMYPFPGPPSENISHSDMVPAAVL